AILFRMTDPDSAVARHLGVNAMWQGWLKVAAYAGFATLLMVPGVTLDFLTAQRGETPAPAAAATAPPPAAAPPADAGPPVELAAEPTTALGGLAGAMKTATALLALVGAFDLVVGFLAVNRAVGAEVPEGAELILGLSRPLWAGVLSMIEGAALAAL